MLPRNAFYAQSGGVTAVINASAAGVLETARKFPKKIGKVMTLPRFVIMVLGAKITGRT